MTLHQNIPEDVTDTSAPDSARPTPPPTTSLSIGNAVFTEAGHTLSLVHCEHPAYHSVLQIRSEAYATPITTVRLPCDAYSYIYCLSDNSSAIATVSSTTAAHGLVDCHEFYNQSLLSAFSDRLVSPYGLAVARSHRGQRVAALRVLQWGWVDQVRRGARIMLINVSVQMVSYYRRLGFRLVHDTSFIHPRLGTDSRIMVCATNTEHPVGLLERVVADIPDPVTYADIGQYVSLETPHVFGTRHARTNGRGNP